MTDTYTCEVKEVSAGGSGSVAFSSPHIIQYPKQYRPVDGKWAALASIIGSMIGKWANADKLSEASDAEDTWKDLNDQLKAKGIEEWGRIVPERLKAEDADTVLDNKADWLCDKGVEEKAYSDKLKDCTDSAFEKLCALLECGYSPDYDGILARASADAAKEFENKEEELCRSLNRYNAAGFACITKDLSLSRASAIVGTTTLARQGALETAWKMNSDIAFKVAQQLESTRSSRALQALQWTQACTAIQTNRYQWHNENGYNSLKLGADLLASAGQNYAWLAESLRKSAELDSGNFGALAALVVALIPQFMTCSFQEPEDCEEKKKDETPSAGGTTTP